MSLLVDSALDLSVPRRAEGSYRMTRLLALDTTSVTLQNTTVTEKLFEIPTSIVFNPSRSTIDFDVSFATATASRYIRAHMVHSMFSRLSLETRNGVRIVDLPYCAEWMKSIVPIATQNSELQQKEFGYDCSGGALSKSSSFFRSNDLASATSANGPNSTRISVVGASEAPITSYQDIQYVTQAGTTAGLELSLTMKFSIPLSEFKQTALSLDKNLHFGQSLNLRLTFNPIVNVGFIGSSVSEFDTASAALTSVAVSNLYMYLAVQVNNAVVADVINKTNTTGWSIPVDYPYTYLNSPGTVTQASIQTRLNRGNGTKVKAIVTSFYSGNPNVITRYDHSNYLQAKISTIQSSLNSKPLQDIVLSTANREDWEFQRHNLTDSAVQNSDMYAYNYSWIDAWSDLPLCLTNSMDVGLDLSNEQLYTVTTTNPSGSYRIFTFAICKRDLVVSPGGIDVQII